MSIRLILATIFVISLSAHAEIYDSWEIQRISIKKASLFCGRNLEENNKQIDVFKRIKKRFVSYTDRIKSLKQKKRSKKANLKDLSELKKINSNKKRFKNICIHFWDQLDQREFESSDATPTTSPTLTSSPTVSSTPYIPTITPTQSATNTSTPVAPTITPTQTATNTSTPITPTITATPTSTPGEINLPSCPSNSQTLELSDPRPYIVSESTERSCPVLIPEGARIIIQGSSQLTFNEKVTINSPSNGSPQKIFYASWAENEVKAKWWITPVIFHKRQILFPEWFGGKLCTRNDPTCSDATIPFQLAVNSLNAGKAKTLEEINSQNLSLDENIGGSIIAFNFYSPPIKYFRLDRDVIITRHHVTLDLRNNYFHKDGGSAGARFICDGDRSRSTESTDEGRNIGFLQSNFSSIEDRWKNALFGCTIKRARFGIPKTESSSNEDSINMSGIANMLWVTGGLLEDVTRYGQGLTGISLNITRDSTIRRANIFGSRDSYFTFDQPTNTYTWQNRQIGILVHLSTNAHIIDSNIKRGAYFAGIQVKGGEDNQVEKSSLVELRDPIEKLRIATPTGTVTPGIAYEPIPFVNGTPLAYDNTPAKLNYGSRNGFWDRGDSPYVTPAADPSLLPKYSYPYDGKSFADADERRQSSRTVWRDLNIIDSPNYNAYSNTESAFSTYENVKAYNVSSGFVFTRSQNGKEAGHEIKDFEIKNVKIQGLIAQNEATPKPTASPNPATPTPTINYSELIKVVPSTNGLNTISNLERTPTPGPTPYCYKPKAGAINESLLSGKEGINCSGF